MPESRDAGRFARDEDAGDLRRSGFVVRDFGARRFGVRALRGARDLSAMTTAQARMFPRQAPFAPTVHQLHRNGRLFPPNYLHDSWLDYLYWDTELDP